MSDTTREPAAWAVLDSRGMVCVADVCREAAEAYCVGTCNRLAPLYRQPQLTLTDAEREAVEWAACEADEYEEDEPLPHQHAAALRNLFARLGGGE